MAIFNSAKRGLIKVNVFDNVQYSGTSRITIEKIILTLVLFLLYK